MNSKNLLFFWNKLVHKLATRAIFHPTMGTPLVIDISTKEATTELSYEVIKEKDNGLHRAFVS